MLDFTDINITAVTGAQALYTLKQRLKANGWTIPSSSDGSTYSASADLITSGSSGAAGMANNSAWFRMKMPGTTREYVVQRGTVNTDWRIKYSYLAGFTGGTPGTTRVPSAADEVVLVGGGSDAVPTFTTIFAADSSYRYQVIAGGASDGYGFISLGYATGAVATHCWILDPLCPGYPSQEADPYVHIMGTAAIDGLDVAQLSNVAATSPTGPRCWMKPGLSGAAFVQVTALKLVDSAATIFPGGTVANPLNAAAEGMPVAYYGRTTTPAGFKGWSTFLEWVGPTHTKWDTQSVGGGSKNRILATSVQLPWKGDGTVPLA